MLWSRRHPALTALIIVLVIAKFAWNLHYRQKVRAYTQQTIDEIHARDAARQQARRVTAVNTAQQTAAILDSIRTHGYRVSTHRLLDAVEMRAESITDPAKRFSASIKSSTQGPAADELRCAAELAKKLGLTPAS